jgi:cytochrome c553
MEKNEDSVHKDYFPNLESYIKAYQKLLSDNIKDKNNKAQKLNNAMSIMSGGMSDSNLAQMEAIVKASRRG